MLFSSRRHPAHNGPQQKGPQGVSSASVYMPFSPSVLRLESPPFFLSLLHPVIQMLFTSREASIFLPILIEPRLVIPDSSEALPSQRPQICATCSAERPVGRER